MQLIPSLKYNILTIQKDIVVVLQKKYSPKKRFKIGSLRISKLHALSV